MSTATIVFDALTIPKHEGGPLSNGAKVANNSSTNTC